MNYNCQNIIKVYKNNNSSPNYIDKTKDEQIK